MNLFGKKKAEAPRVPRQDPIETIKTLRDNLDTLEKREIHISKKIDACLDEVKSTSFYLKHFFFLKKTCNYIFSLFFFRQNKKQQKKIKKQHYLH